MIRFDTVNDEENTYCDSCGVQLPENERVTKWPWHLCPRCYNRDYGTADRGDQ